ncbi:DUF4360 domain-containing protein [Candidatus Bathyarchaeota archaeon]|nr:DUF4360 domain-containing protein [Candidatus Bathyarchaeota archaeon]
MEARDTDIKPRQATGVIFESITASGSGCPGGSYTASISPSKDAGTIAFREYSVVTPPSSLECTISVTLTYPGGCTSGNFHSTSHIWAQVNSGLTGTYGTSYTSSTGNSASPADSTFSGPSWEAGEVFIKSDDAPAQVVNRSPNSAKVTVTVKTEISLLGSGSGGDLTPDDMSFVITDQASDSDWENCS